MLNICFCISCECGRAEVTLLDWPSRNLGLIPEPYVESLCHCHGYKCLLNTSQLYFHYLLPLHCVLIRSSSGQQWHKQESSTECCGLGSHSLLLFLHMFSCFVSLGIWLHCVGGLQPGPAMFLIRHLCLARCSWDFQGLYSWDCSQSCSNHTWWHTTNTLSVP